MSQSLDVSLPPAALLAFTQDHLSAFAQLSGDFNPLHMDPEYAARTPFGRQVVFGMAAVLSALGLWARGTLFELAALTAQFDRPLYLNESYALIFGRGLTAGSYTCRIFRGNTIQCRIDFSTRPVSRLLQPLANESLRRALRTDPNEDPDYRPNLVVAQLPYYRVGSKPEMSADCLLNHTLDLMCADQLEVLLWSSYFVGMEFPGKQALFSTLNVEFALNPAGAHGLTIEEFRVEPDERFGRQKFQITTNLRHKVKIQAYRRPVAVEVTLASIRSEVSALPSYSGKLAVVSGAGRGFGATLARTLAVAGARVAPNFRRHTPEIEQLTQELRSSGCEPFLLCGDAGSERDCLSLAGVLGTQATNVDLLINNASPAIPVESFLEQTAADFLEFVTSSLAAYSCFTHALLPAMAPNGIVVFISSAYVSSPRANLSHYLAAKGAIEGMAQGLAKEFKALRFVIVRAPRMLTDQTNVPMSFESCVSPVSVALRVLVDLANLPSTLDGKVREIRWL